MNILGEGFPDAIIDQVHQRQKRYGAGFTGTQRSAEELVYLNANTSWCKLVSSVDIDDPKNIVNQSLSGLTNIAGSSLAERFVLFNGVNDASSGDNQRSGVSKDKDLLGNNNAYGIGGNDFGIRPMMGIQSANIKHENRGSIRRATVKIKAFNKIQFDIIDVLYLRLGFNILLEWGHSMYYDNKGELQTNPQNSLASNFLSGKGTMIPGFPLNSPPTYDPPSYENFLKQIAEQKITSNGNYDAMFAKVTNYHWSFLPDGSYDITLDLVSIGDIVESFKINALVDGLTLSTTTDDALDLTTATDFEIINHYANKNSIGKFFYNLQYKFGKELSTNSGGSYVSRDSITVNTTYASNIATSDEIKTNKKDAILISYGDKDISYVRLGTLLQFFQEKLMYQIKVGSNYSPMLKFDYDEQTNLMYVNNLQVSIDPNVCVVNRILTIGSPPLDYSFAPNAEPFEGSLLESGYGQVMNIYVSMKWILLKLDELKDASNNKVVLIDLLNNMLSAINSALGGTNSLEATIDDTNNTVIIRDMNPLPNTKSVIEKLNGAGKSIPDKYAYFDLYGYSTAEHPVDPSIYKDNNKNLGHASFIKDFNFTTEISPELSTMLTIGATANSTVVGENSTAFSKFNIGLKDRFKEEIGYLPPPTSIGGFSIVSNITYLTDDILKIYEAGQEQEALIKSLSIKYVESKIALDNYLINLSKGIYNGDAETYKDALTNYINFLNQLKQAIAVKLSIKNNKPLSSILPSFAPGTGFIPFNMSLTMDGLSGMKIYSKFFVDTRYLPTNYPDNAEFLIKNIEHKIENNKWFTTIESIVISKGDIDPKQLTQKVNISGGGAGGTGGPFQGIPPGFTTPTIPSTVGINPEEVITFTNGSGNKQHYNSLDVEFRNKFLKLALAYKTKTGKKVTLSSAVRTQAEQTAIYTAWANGVKGIYIPAKVVGKGHGTGTAVDVQDTNVIKALPEFASLGFTGINNDPPHIEIVSLGVGKFVITILSADTTTTPWS
jgi:hypothetical protein